METMDNGKRNCNTTTLFQNSTRLTETIVKEEFGIQGEEEEEARRALWEEEPQKDLQIKEETEVDGISVLVVCEAGQQETASQVEGQHLQTVAGVKPEPEGYEISHHDNIPSTPTLMEGEEEEEEQEEEPRGQTLKEEPEAVEWETSFPSDAQEQETGSGVDPFLLGTGGSYEDYSLSTGEFDSEDGHVPAQNGGMPGGVAKIPSTDGKGEHAPDFRYGGSVAVSSPVFPCVRCPVSFTVELYLHRHLKRSHPEDYTALLRPESLEPPSNTTVAEATTPTKHVPSSQERPGVTATKAHACPDCEKSFSRKSDLRVHQRSHTGERPYHCAQCGRSFGVLYNLTRHERTHAGLRPHRCAQCAKAFVRAEDLRKHQRTHGGERQRCSHCGKSFSHAETLRAHMRGHTGERPYHCAQCGKTFSLSRDLNKHQVTHTGERPYHCAQCGKTFSLSRDLKKHQVTHTGERPYPCAQCGKRFGRVWDLTTHQRSHSGERPYHCSQCGQRFSLIGNFRRHQLSHTGQRTFHCAQCAKSFVRAAHLKHHLQTHTQEKEFLCTRCGKSFNHLGNFKRHQRSHPGE